MNRRNFLRLFGAGLPAAVVAEKLGLVEKARKYFFAPKEGWPIGSITPDMLRRVSQLMNAGALAPEKLIVHPSQLEALIYLAYNGVYLFDSNGVNRISEPLYTEYVLGGIPLITDEEVAHDTWREVYRTPTGRHIESFLHGYRAT